MDKRKRKRLIKKLKKYPYPIDKCWDLFVYLAEHIERSLIEFKELPRYGVPYAFHDNHQGWEDTLDTMIWTFHELANNNPEDPYWIYFSKQDHELSIGKDGAVHFTSSSDTIVPEEVREANRIYEKKIDTGLLLFTKYFRDLWD